MTINNRLQALHCMAELRRMELFEFDQTATGDRVWTELFTACENFFADAPENIWERFANS